VAVEPEDIWHIGSDTKAMTATLVARLAEQGRLSWDDTVADHLGDAAPRMNSAYRDMTFTHLLSHRAGVPANVGVMGMLQLAGADADRDAAADRARYTGWMLRKRPAVEAEAEFLYSNAGYVIAASMVEAATGETYENLMAREVFEPLGLTTAGWGPPGSTDAIDQPRGHKGDPPRAVGLGAGADNPVAMNSAGRVHMSLADVARFAGAHMAAERGDEVSYLSAQSWSRLHTPPFGGGYAMGWGVGADGSLRHAGSNTMWLLQIVAWPEHDRAVIVAFNDGRVAALRGHVADVVEGLAPERADAAD